MATATNTVSNGFKNLLARENTVWWRSKRWLLHMGLSVLGLNGLLAFILFVLPGIVAATGDEINAHEAGIQLFFGLGFMALAVDAVILLQDTIIGERQSGAAEWVLSKPISRKAYVLAKLAANALGMIVTLMIAPGVVGYVIFSLAEGTPIATGPYLTAYGLLALHTLFYIVLTLLMGVFTENRGLLLGVSLGMLLGGGLLMNLVGAAAMVTPWPLSQIAVSLLLGTALPPMLLLPIIMTGVLTIVLLALTLWRFERVEL